MAPASAVTSSGLLTLWANVIPEIREWSPGGIQIFCGDGDEVQLLFHA